jgi:hypothetical protein
LLVAATGEFRDYELIVRQQQRVRSGDRATEFKQRCEGLGIKG